VVVSMTSCGPRWASRRRSSTVAEVPHAARLAGHPSLDWHPGPFPSLPAYGQDVADSRRRGVPDLGPPARPHETAVACFA
jgi:hypothetical protein